MRCRRPEAVFLLVGAMLALPVRMVSVQAAQEPGIQWMSDLEAAKAQAKQTGRLVLVHFWTPSCQPCLMLDQTVFNQANVAATLEQRFVLVKLNANENSATAQGFGITRVPTDVIITPDGQVVGKLISPPTPAGYLAEVTQAAANYAVTPGGNYAAAVSQAPMQSAFPPGASVNAAYANLPIAPGTVPAMAEFSNLPQPTQTAPMLGVVPPSSFASNGVNANAPVGATPPPITPIGVTPPPAPPLTTYNPLASNPAYGAQATSGYGQPTAPALAAQPVGPVQVENRYAAAPGFATGTAAVSAQPVAASSQPFVPQPPVGVAPSGDNGTPALITGTSSAALSLNPNMGAANVPPASAAGTGGVAASAAHPNAGLVAGVPDPSQLPAGAPPLGFDGYCPVSMRNHWKWVPGDPRWGVVHRGRTYWFSSQNEQQQFWADPDRFSPALSGMDPVMAIDHQQQVPGKREHSIDYDNLFYMFSSEATLAQFTANPERYAVGVRQAMGIQRGRLVR